MNAASPDLNQQALAPSAMRSMVGRAAVLAFGAGGAGLAGGEQAGGCRERKRADGLGEGSGAHDEAFQTGQAPLIRSEG